MSGYYDDENDTQQADDGWQDGQDDDIAPSAEGGDDGDSNAPGVDDAGYDDEVAGNDVDGPTVDDGGDDDTFNTQLADGGEQDDDSNVSNALENSEQENDSGDSTPIAVDEYDASAEVSIDDGGADARSCYDEDVESPIAVINVTSISIAAVELNNGDDDSDEDLRASAYDRGMLQQREQDAYVREQEAYATEQEAYGREQAAYDRESELEARERALLARQQRLTDDRAQFANAKALVSKAPTAKSLVKGAPSTQAKDSAHGPAKATSPNPHPLKNAGDESDTVDLLVDVGLRILDGALNGTGSATKPAPPNAVKPAPASAAKSTQSQVSKKAGPVPAVKKPEAPSKKT
ncbi:hypothetical protein B0H10DRAFT_2207968 [Mycena sp. CBHHK59/15]|nr:hypothetical protein B0H10DRAFT_2207968 [Mycena sp. CBHHK59/15]